MELLNIQHPISNPNLLLSQTHFKSLHPFKTHASFSLSHPTKSQFSTPQLSQTTRRSLNLSLIALLVSFSFPFKSTANDQSFDELQRYTDAKEGFTLLIPPSYLKVEKAGATVLFEEEKKGANNVGVVVSPVKLASLKEFGTLQFVADKLIQAEKRKESTRDAELIGVAERPGIDGLPVYELEYVVDSTRGGVKRVFTAAFISGKKLFLLNISHVDKPDNSLDSHTRKMLEQVLHSFDAVPLSQNSV